jgi:predicted PurR-regulated permease PerM
VTSVPCLNWLQRKGVPLLAALILVITGIRAVGFGIAVFLGTPLDSCRETPPFYQERLQQEVARFAHWLERNCFICQS